MSDSFVALPFVLADRYDVSAELGRGGFAVVFRARDRVLERDVAIKVLRDDQIPESTRRRFSREMQVTARLEHPNILHVYDTGTWSGRPYYVMEFVRGETLETRLGTVGALQVDDALSITREVGLALAFAHAMGVVHRDVKPANILLGNGGAVLGDFGIAHVKADSVAGRITSTGMAVGTTQYMSPEQLCAEPIIDARSDQYSLALVCYEMLTGVQPFVASGFDALRALRTLGNFAPVGTHRPSAPEHVDDAIARALSPAPADRFRDVREFLSALDVRDTGDRVSAPRAVSRRNGARATPSANKATRGPGARRRLINRWTIAAVVGVAAAAVASTPFMANAPWTRAPVAGTDAAPTVALVTPIDRGDSLFATRVQAELGDWRDVSVLRALDLPRAEVDDETSLRKVATRAHAVLIIRPATLAVGDSVRWSLASYDSRSGKLAQVSHTAARGSELDAGALRAMITRALMGAASDSAPGIGSLREPVLAAARAYVSGWALMRAGVFDSARTMFGRAATAAPSFAHADLWAAQLGAWSTPRDAASWRDAARRAATNSAALHGTDSVLAMALVALASNDWPAACARYREAIAREPDSFVGWYGLGQCQQFDALVIRDTRAENGVRFRSSHWSALHAYEEALSRLPAPGMSALFVPVVRITYASGNLMRRGEASPPDSTKFLGVISLSGDSLVTIPDLADRVSSVGPVPESFSRALKRARTELVAFTQQWTLRAPTSADAWYNRAYALELTGNFDAPDEANSAARSLERAAGLAVSEELRARIDVARVRIAVRRGLWNDAERLSRAAMARAVRLTPGIAVLRAPLAAFVGDGELVASLLRTAATNLGERNRLPPWAASDLAPWLADSLRSFGVRATLGLCDGLAGRRDALEAGFREHVAANELAERRQALLRDVYRAAVPCLGASVLRGFSPKTPLDHAIVALDSGDKPGARAVLDGLLRSRRGMSVTTVTEDALLAEVWVSMQTGDMPGSRARVRATMQDLASVSASTFDEFAQAAALARLRKLDLAGQ